MDMKVDKGGHDFLKVNSVSGHGARLLKCRGLTPLVSCCKVSAGYDKVLRRCEQAYFAPVSGESVVLLCHIKLTGIIPAQSCFSKT